MSQAPILSSRPARKGPQPLAYSQRVAAHPQPCPEVRLEKPKASCVPQKSNSSAPNACLGTSQSPLVTPRNAAPCVCIPALYLAQKCPTCPIRGEITDPNTPLLQTSCLPTDSSHSPAPPSCSLPRNDTAPARPLPCCRAPDGPLLELPYGWRNSGTGSRMVTAKGPEVLPLK